MLCYWDKVTGGKIFGIIVRSIQDAIRKAMADASGLQESQMSADGYSGPNKQITKKKKIFILFYLAIFSLDNSSDIQWCNPQPSTPSRGAGCRAWED